MNAIVSTIATARLYIGISLDAIQQILGETARPVPGDEYGQMTELTSIENPDVFPGTLYLRNGSTLLIRIGRKALTAVTPVDIRECFGHDIARLPSPAGKRAHLWVWADQGIACSVQDETVHFLEVFSPCSLDEYETRIYREPPRFIR